MKKLIFSLTLFLLPFQITLGQSLDDQLLDAVKANNLSAVQRLLKKGADANAVDSLGASALMWSVYNQNLDVAKLLVAQDALLKQNGIILATTGFESVYTNLVGIAAENGDVDMLRYLHEDLGLSVCDQEWNPITDEPLGWTAITRAFVAQRSEVFQYLTDNGCDLLLDFRNDLKRTGSENRYSVDYLATMSYVANLHYEFDSLLLSKEIYEDALRVAESMLPSTRSQVIEIANLLGYLNMKLSNSDKAFEAYRIGVDQCLLVNMGPKDCNMAYSLIELSIELGNYEFVKDLHSKIFEHDSSGYAMAVADLAYRLQKKNKFDIAEDFYLESLEVTEKVHGDRSKESCILLSDLSFLFREKGNLERAIYFEERRLSIIETLNDFTTEDLSSSLRTLAHLNWDLGDPANAEMYFGRLLDVQENDSLDYASDLQLFGIFQFQVNGDYFEANKSLKEANRIIQTIYGENHPKTSESLFLLGVSYERSGMLDSASWVMEESLNVWPDLRGDTVQLLKVLTNLIDVYIKQYKFKDADTLLKEVVKLSDTQNSTHVTYLMRAKNSQGLINAHLGNYRKSLSQYFEALKIDGDGYQHSRENLAQLYENIGQAYTNLFLFDSANHYYLKLGDLMRELFSLDHPKYGVYLESYAQSLMRQSRFVEAEGQIRDALETFTTEYDTIWKEYSIALHTLAMIRFEQGDVLGATSMLKRLLIDRSRIFGAASLEAAGVLDVLAQCQMAAGFLSEAEKSIHKSLEIREMAVGIQHPDYQMSLNTLALILSEKGEYDKLEGLYERLIGQCQETYGEKDLACATLLNNFAGYYSDIGDYDKAFELYSHSLSVREKALPEDHPQVVLAMSNLGSLLITMQLPELAMETFENAVERSKGRPDSKKVFILASSNLALMYGQAKLLEKADSIYDSLFDEFERDGNVDNAEFATLLSNRSLVAMNDDNWFEAERMLKQSISINSRVYGQLNPNQISALTNLMICYRKLNRSDDAGNCGLRITEVLLSAFESGFQFMSSREKLNYTQSYTGVFRRLKALSYQFKDDPDILNNHYSIELFAKGMVLKSGSSMRDRVIRSGNQELTKLLDQFVRFKSQKVRNVSIPDSIITEMEMLEKQLVRMSSEFAEMQQLGKLSWQDIQVELGEDDVAIEFSSFPYYRPDGTWSDSTVYVALVLRKDYEHPVMVKLCEEKQLDSLFQGEVDRELIADLYRGAVPVGESGPSYGKRLYELLWEPLDTFLNEDDRIHFAPSGLLHRIALSAIPYGDSDQLLSDRYYLNRLSTTAKLVTDKDKQEKRPEEIVLFGGIDYDFVPSKNDKEQETYLSRALPMDLDRDNTSWSYLPGTLKETESIATIASSKKVKVTTYTGTEATEEQIKSLGGKNSPTILHIASHGFFFPDPEKDYEKDRMMQMMGDREQVYRYSDDPLNRAGLLFSGANHTWRDGEVPEGSEDGILTANEATYIPLTNTELVVLSACETGLGEIKGSEGVFGMQRAFKAAGAEYVMMSLWKVPDQETSEFMESFYGHYLSDHTIPDSYHHAQRVMREKYPNDLFKWAGFVLMR